MGRWKQQQQKKKKYAREIESEDNKTLVLVDWQFYEEGVVALKATQQKGKSVKIKKEKSRFSFVKLCRLLDRSHTTIDCHSCCL